MAEATVVALLSALAVAACGWVFRVLLARRIALSNPDWRVYEQLFTGVLGGAMAAVWFNGGHLEVLVGALIGSITADQSWFWFRHRPAEKRIEPLRSSARHMPFVAGRKDGAPTAGSCLAVRHASKRDCRQRRAARSPTDRTERRAPHHVPAQVRHAPP